MRTRTLAHRGPAYATGVLMISLLLCLVSSPLAATKPVAETTGKTTATKKAATTSTTKTKPSTVKATTKSSTAPSSSSKVTTKTKKKSATPQVSPSTRGARRDARTISRRTGRHVEPRVTPPGKSKVKKSQLGIASFYGREFANRPTASGELFDPRALTAAHRTLPLGTRVRVTNLENGRQAVLRINDRGPYRNNRVLDVSRAAARRLGFLQHGIAHVRIEVLKPRRGDKMPYRRAESARLASEDAPKPRDRG